MQLRVLLLFAAILLPACRGHQSHHHHHADAEHREASGIHTAPSTHILIAGQPFNIGTRVVLWTEPDGYDAYRTEARFAPRGEHRFEDVADKVGTPNRYGLRFEKSMTDEQFQQHRGGSWTLQQLRERIDLFVIHYDACGTSRRCFEVLHDHRGLSVHFMLDVDGTIYQTLDVKERAWHAAEYNDRSVGIEIANIGAYPTATAKKTLSAWYRTVPDGRAQLIIPAKEKPWIYTPNFVGYSARNKPVIGEIHRQDLAQYDLTPQQYRALGKLTAALHLALPRIELKYPTDSQGNARNDRMSEAELTSYSGLVGHYHLTEGKIDPGPAFDWARVLRDARAISGQNK